MTNDRTPSKSVARGLAVLLVGGAVALALVGTAVAKGPPSSHPSPGPKGPHASAQPSGSPDAQLPRGAKKVSLYLDSAFTCTTTPVPAKGSKAYGFAVLNTTASGMLNVTVSLKRAAPNATFTVTIDQGMGGCGSGASPGASPSASPSAAASASPSASPSVAPVVTLRTNRKGNGTVHLRIPIVAGATAFSVTATGPDQTLRSKNVLLTVKKPAASPSTSPSAPPSTSPSA